MAKLLAKAVTGQSTDIALTGAAETVVIASQRVQVRVATCLVHIRAWGQWTPGTGTTGLTARLYRWGTGEGGPLGEVNQIPRAAGSGSTETVMLEAVELRRSVESVQYVLSVEQVGASGAGSFIQGALEVEVLSG